MLTHHCYFSFTLAPPDANPMKQSLACMTLLTAALLLAGCGQKQLPLEPVSGKVVFPDGSVPQGEVAVVKFEPANPDTDTKAASGDIQPDGTFQLTTIEDNDGALPGEYRVRILIWKTYIGRESMIDKKYDDPNETPLRATVKEGEKNEFTFEVE